MMRILTVGSWEARTPIPTINKTYRHWDGSPIAGFTLIELVVAIVIIGIVAGALTAAFGGFAKTQDFQSSVTRLVFELRAAAEQAKTTGSQVRVYFDTDTNSYEIWRIQPAPTPDPDGNTATLTAAFRDHPVQLPNSVKLSDFELTGTDVSAADSPDDSNSSATLNPGSTDSSDSDLGWPDFSDMIVFSSSGAATVVQITLESSSGQSQIIQVSANGRVDRISNGDNSNGPSPGP